MNSQSKQRRRRQEKNIIKTLTQQNTYTDKRLESEIEIRNVAKQKSGERTKNVSMSNGQGK